MSRLPLPARLFINEGMRTGVRDEQARRRTVCVYTEKESLRQQLGLAHEGTVWALLIGREGRIIATIEGPADKAGAATLRAALLAHTVPEDATHGLN